MPAPQGLTERVKSSELAGANMDDWKSQSCRVTDCANVPVTKKDLLCQSHYNRKRKGLMVEVSLKSQKSPEEKELILRRHGFEPLEPYPGAKKRWLCKCKSGHETKISVERLETNYESCQKCRTIPLPVSHPHLVRLWNSELNSETSIESLSKGSETKVYWNCEEGHAYLASPMTMTRNPRPGCGVCSGHQVIAGVNDLKTQAVGLCAIWDSRRNTVPESEVYVKSQSKYWFLCRNEHPYQTSPARLHETSKRGNSGCPYCANLKLLAGWNDLQSVSPELAREMVRADKNLDPSMVLAFSGKKYGWKCEVESHPVFFNSPQVRVRNSKGCPICGGTKVESGVNDALSLNPDLEMIWSMDNSFPLDILRTLGPSSEQIFKWKCRVYGHNYHTSLYSAFKGVGCKVCKNLELLVGFNDLASSQVADEYDQKQTEAHRAELGLDGVDLSPEKLLKGTKRDVYWRCRSNSRHSWTARISLRANRKNPVQCPYCSGRNVDRGRNDLASQFPELLVEWSPKNEVDPSEISFGSNKKVWWKCALGHSDYEAAPHNRTKAKSTGCPDCNTGGFETAKSAYLYFIKNSDLGAGKIGISNQDARPNRLSVWKKLGWTEVCIWEHDYGRVIANAETIVLREVVRGELQLPVAVGKNEMGSSSGSKETFPWIQHLESFLVSSVDDAISKSLTKFEESSKAVKKDFRKSANRSSS